MDHITVAPTFAKVAVIIVRRFTRHALRLQVDTSIPTLLISQSYPWLRGYGSDIRRLLAQRPRVAKRAKVP